MVSRTSITVLLTGGVFCFAVIDISGYMVRTVCFGDVHNWYPLIFVVQRF